jgi:hypothetical protein
VLALVRRKLEAARDGQLTEPSFLATLYAAAPPLVRFVARAAVDGSPAGAALMDELAESTEAFFTRTWPDRFPPGSERTRDAAAVLVTQSVGTLVLHEHVARRMGLEAWKSVLSPRIGLAQLDVYEAIGRYVASSFGAEIREATAALEDEARGQA